MAKEQKYSMIASPQCGWCKKALIMLVENLKDVELFVHDIRSPELWEEVRGYDCPVHRHWMNQAHHLILRIQYHIGVDQIVEPVEPKDLHRAF